MKALIIDNVSPLIPEGLKARGVEVHIEVMPGTERIKEIIGEYDILIMRVVPPIGRDILDCADKLKIIAVCSVGTEHIDHEAAKEKGITIMNAASGSTNGVAELTMCKILELNRHTVRAQREVVEDGIWEKNHFKGHELKGQTLGIIGIGRIGSRVAELASAFGMKIIACDPYLTKEEIAARGAEKKELNELLAEADCISMHLPLTPESVNMISYEQIDRMKPGAVFINMSRGGHVDEEALAYGLKSGKLGGVGMDVIKDEVGDLTGGDKLYSPVFHAGGEFVVSPHIGAVTAEAQTKIGHIIVDQLSEALHLN